MALIACPECARDISDRAPTCPHCGSPATPTVQTIQATGKGWKGWQIAGVLTMVLGLATCGASVAGGNDPSTASLLLLILGFSGYLFARIGAWWHHG